MIRLLKLAAVLTAIWAVWSFVPIHRRTLADRWRVAPTAGAFAVSGWRELRAALGAAEQPGNPQAHPQARHHSRDSRPAEGHTDSDRRAVDRIVSKHL